MPGVWVGIVVSLVGSGRLTGIDFHLDPRSLFGDVLALVGAALAAYVTTGEQARQSLTTANYAVVAYAVSALVLLPLCFAFGASLTGYSARDWALILGLTAIAQILGHTLVNVVLQSTSATVVSLAILFELPGAIIVAAVFLGQVPPADHPLALVLLAAGLVLVVRASRADQPVAARVTANLGPRAISGGKSAAPGVCALDQVCGPRRGLGHIDGTRRREVGGGDGYRMSSACVGTDLPLIFARGTP